MRPTDSSVTVRRVLKIQAANHLIPSHAHVLTPAQHTHRWRTGSSPTNLKLIQRPPFRVNGRVFVRTDHTRTNQTARKLAEKKVGPFPIIYGYCVVVAVAVLCTLAIGEYVWFPPPPNDIQRFVAPMRFDPFYRRVWTDGRRSPPQRSAQHKVYCAIR